MRTLLLAAAAALVIGELVEITFRNLLLVILLALLVWLLLPRDWR